MLLYFVVVLFVLGVVVVVVVFVVVVAIVVVVLGIGGRTLLVVYVTNHRPRNIAIPASINLEQTCR